MGIFIINQLQTKRQCDSIVDITLNSYVYYSGDGHNYQVQSEEWLDFFI